MQRSERTLQKCYVTFGVIGVMIHRRLWLYLLFIDNTRHTLAPSMIDRINIEQNLRLVINIS